MTLFLLGVLTGMGLEALRRLWRRADAEVITAVYPSEQRRPDLYLLGLPPLDEERLHQAHAAHHIDDATLDALTRED
jgi:hypothetical protein